MNKCYSRDEEDYSYDSHEEAAQYVWENDGEFKVGDTITLWEADAVPIKASRFTPSMSEYLTEAAYEHIREYSDSWQFTEAQEKDLQEAVDRLVDEWADKNDMQPRFYDVRNPKPFLVRFTNEDGDCEIVEEQP